MTPLLFTLAVVGISLLAGFLGSLLGLGGGLIVIPALTLVLHVDIRLAIGASIVSVIATSSGAAAAYVCLCRPSSRFIATSRGCTESSNQWGGPLHHAGRPRIVRISAKDEKMPMLFEIVFNNSRRVVGWSFRPPK